MNKNDLASQLTNAKNNYILGLAAISLFSTDESYPILDKNRANFGHYTVTFDKVADLLRKETDRNIAIKEFLTMLIRALIKESFEIIKDYCETTGQSSLLKSEVWYQFARIIRNCLSHNFKFEFNNYDKNLLPIKWKNHIITVALDGQHLELNFFGYVETWELFQEFQDFVEKRLQ